MAAFPQSAEPGHRPLPWFWRFLKEELSPYPGRTLIVARMVTAATLVMIIGMTYRLSFTFQAAIVTLLISRETVRSTLQSAGTTILVTGLGTLSLIITAWFVISSPALHFVSNIAVFLVAFFALNAVTSYVAASLFAIIISFGVPLWDRHVPAEINVEDTLRLMMATSIGVVVTAAVELLFARRQRGDALLPLIAERLDAVRSLLVSYAEGGTADPAAAKRIARLALLGTSLVRRLLRRSDHSARYRAEMGAIAALVGQAGGYSGRVDASPLRAFRRRPGAVAEPGSHYRHNSRGPDEPADSRFGSSRRRNLACLAFVAGNGECARAHLQGRYGHSIHG